MRWRTAFSYTIAILLVAGLLIALLYYTVEDAAQRNKAVFGVLAAAALLVSLAAFQAERAARTVRQLTAAAERIAGGDLSARILSRDAGDIGHLAHAFNRMAGKLEEEMLQSAREHDRLNTVLQVMVDGVLIINRKGIVRLINPAAAALLQSTEEDALHRSFVQVVRDHRIAEVWQRCQRTHIQESAALDLGAGRFLRVVVTPLLSGPDHGYLVLLQDLSRMRHLQTIRQDFISNVSHELRTPLASLRALVDTLRDGALDDPPTAQRFLDRMETEVDSLTQLVQELLELSRIESGRVPLRLSPTPAADAVAPGAERLRPQAERAQITLEIDLPPDLPPVLVDAERIRQVVTNLVHNAIKFTPPGGRVRVSAQPGAGRLVVTVQDTGVGIARQELPRIFERFYKTDRARAGGGTGLGLAIVKHLVQAHEGDIWAESNLGEGSRFHFSLPLAASEPPSPPR